MECFNACVNHLFVFADYGVESTLDPRDYSNGILFQSCDIRAICLN